MKLCPFCKGGPSARIEKGFYFIQCRFCETRTKLFATRDEAEAFWDARNRRGIPRSESPPRKRKPLVRRPNSIEMVGVSNTQEITQSALNMLGNYQAFGVFGTVACQLEQ
ncbi:MAG: hypothetical protein CL536_03425 [Alcaligenaceae bacterium]|nr:hypothetical protein [Alcaligenaceae bacterium]